MALSWAPGGAWRRAARPAWPWGQTPLRSLLGTGTSSSPCSCPCRTSTSKAAEARAAEPPVLHAFEAEVEADAHMHMLASPLRRCAVSNAVLPSALMMRLEPIDLPAPAVPGKSGDKQPESEPRATDKKASGNPANAEDETLGPDIEIAPAKKIRQRVLLPSTIQSHKRTWGRRGRGVWVSLDHEIAKLAPVRHVNRRIAGCKAPPENLPALILDELCRQLLGAAKALYGAKAGKTRENWLVRRVKGRAWQELLGVASQESDALATDAHDDAVWHARQQVAAILVFPGEAAASASLPDGPPGSAPPSSSPASSTSLAGQSATSVLPPSLQHMRTPPVYEMTRLLSASTTQTLHDALRAITINTRQTKPSIGAGMQGVGAAETTAGDTLARSSTPRIVALQRSAATVPLAIALHRLALWQGS